MFFFTHTLTLPLEPICGSPLLVYVSSLLANVSPPILDYFGTGGVLDAFLF